MPEEVVEKRGGRSGLAEMSQRSGGRRRESKEEPS